MIIKLSLLFTGLILFSCGNINTQSREGILQWQPYELTFEASSADDWREFPMKCIFTHSEGTIITLDAYWDGPKTWKVRFAPTKEGVWNWRTHSSDSGLDGSSGTIRSTPATSTDTENNTNYRGKIKVSDNKRYFIYADGTPVLPLAEQLWDFNESSWMSLDANAVNSIEKYLDDRNLKGFNIVQFRMNGINEGGNPFIGNAEKPGNGDFSNINADWFQRLDDRMEMCFDRGFMVAAHFDWLGYNLMISNNDAVRLQRYLLARYGAYNLFLSLSGEFNLNFASERRTAPQSINWNNGTPDFDIETDTSPWKELGRATAAWNAYGTPISIHPWCPWMQTEKFYSSSDFLHDEEWLDHNWIQTYAGINDVPEKVRKDYDLIPVKPVFFSEGIREGDQTDLFKIGEYGMRWEAWQVFLSGGCVHTYRHQGVYMQRWYKGGNIPPWWEGPLDAPGSAHVGTITKFLQSLPWQNLVPAREYVRVNGNLPEYPSTMTEAELNKCVNMAAHFGHTYVVYIPNKNQNNTIEIQNLQGKLYTAKWFDARTGSFIEINDGKPIITGNSWIIPNRPDDKDWALLITTATDVKKSN